MAHRALTAIVYTDAVGFSALVQHDEEAALKAVQDDFAFMREVVERHDGRVLKTMGDGMLIAFDSAVQAVESALEMQRVFGERGEGALQHRMGVHLCDVVIEEHDAHGDGVNLAARLEAEASPGGICLSQTIYDVVKSRLPVQAKFLGERHLKNLIEPVKVFEIAPNNAPRGQRIPPKGKRNFGGPVVVGLCVFGGLCVVAFAVMQIRPTQTVVYRNQPTREVIREVPVRVPVRVPSSDPKPVAASKPKVRLEAEPPVQPLPKFVPKASVAVDEKKPATVTVSKPPAVLPATPAARDLPAEAEQVRKDVQERLSKYDFAGVLAILERVPPESKPARIVELSENVAVLQQSLRRTQADLAARPLENALSVSIPGARGSSAQLYSANGQIMMLMNGRETPLDLAKLNPVALRILLSASARERKEFGLMRDTLRAFDQVYGRALRGTRSAGGTGAEPRRWPRRGGNAPPSPPEPRFNGEQG